MPCSGMGISMSEKKSRQLNYELLRIIAMLMIVCLHYLSKGGFLGEPSEKYISVSGYAAWLLEAFCLVAVNVYVLISGYFGVTSEKKDVLYQPVRIWKQVFFYSIAIGALSMSIGLQEFDIYQCFTYLFPVVTEHYWFASSYIILCLLMPFLNKGVQCLERKSLVRLICVLLLLFSVSKTLLPMQLAWDKYGYDALWFIVMYLTGAYISRYGLKPFETKAKAVILYVGSVLVIFSSFAVIRHIYFATGSLKDFINYSYAYNYFFCYLGAVGLFMTFRHINPSEHIRKPLELISGSAFGVYLIHEHINVRYFWTELFHCSEWNDASLLGFFVHMTFTVLTVYTVCTLIEILRKKLCSVISAITIRIIRK